MRLAARQSPSELKSSRRAWLLQAADVGDGVADLAFELKVGAAGKPVAMIARHVAVAALDVDKELVDRWLGGVHRKIDDRQINLRTSEPLTPRRQVVRRGVGGEVGSSASGRNPYKGSTVRVASGDAD